MASSDERSSRAYDLSEEVNKKLSQAKAICGVIMHMKTGSLIEDSLSAAEDLIEEAQKAFKDLLDIYHEYEYPTKAKAVQS